MGKEEEKQEIIVNAPSKSAVSSEKKVEKAKIVSIETERYNVLQISKKMSRYIGLSSSVIGTLLLFVVVFLVFIEQGSLTFYSFMVSIPMLVLWLSVGIISIIVGFLLIGNE
ncbi:MAG: hypothetical protein GX638_17460 [Crenarchaeota archaeon]|nr:hypothetical protein [Thermoproteota archaeon]